MEINKVYITGHTSGVGKFLCEYFLDKNITVFGVSRKCSSDSKIKNLHEEKIDILNTEKILDSILKFSPDIFINNACAGFQQSQILIKLSEEWKNTKKIIINISSNSSDFTFLELDRFAFSDYDISKLSLDQQSRKSQFSCSELKIINFRPGLIDTPRVVKYKSPKMERKQFLLLVDSVLKLLSEGVYIQEVTFSQVDQFKK